MIYLNKRPFISAEDHALLIVAGHVAAGECLLAQWENVMDDEDISPNDPLWSVQAVGDKYHLYRAGETPPVQEHIELVLRCCLFEDEAKGFNDKHWSEVES